MIQWMTRKQSKRVNLFEWTHFIKLAKRRFKKRFKKSISPKEIKKMWDTWIQYRIIDSVIQGGVIQIDKHSTIEIVGTPVLEDKRFFKMLMRGKSTLRNGIVKNATLNSRRRDYKFKIVYINKLAKDKDLYFQGVPKFSKQVHEAIVNQNYYYRINVNK